ncbi:Uncharacterised protein [Vibrio cholerae]|nr:Uncharacterised protein [Vibrio cholerae]
MPRSLPNATIEPVKVTAPIKIPRNTSTKWITCSAWVAASGASM